MGRKQYTEEQIAFALRQAELGTAVAERLGCDPVEITVEREIDALMKRLTPIQRRRFQKRLDDGADQSEGQGVA